VIGGLIVTRSHEPAVGDGAPVVTSASAAIVAVPAPLSFAPAVVAPPVAATDAAPEDPLAPTLASAQAALAKNDANGALALLAPLQATSSGRADVQRVLERAHVMLHDRASALKDADAWLASDPSAAADLALQTDVGEIATHPTTSAAAITLLASRMGAPGVDILYDLAFASKQRPSVASRAAAALADPGVRGHAGPAAAVLLDLRAATTCEARRALLPRVKTDGDRRALLLLKPWLAAKRDNACFRKDGDLAGTISAVSGRTGML
jgi:uncharacterized protein HemY